MTREPRPNLEATTLFKFQFELQQRNHCMVWIKVWFQQNSKPLVEILSWMVVHFGG